MVESEQCSCGLMDKALPSGGRDCGFESRLGLPFFRAKIFTRGGIRTRGLLLRRETRYPLRYTDSISSDSLVVMTSALHAEGREFNPRSEQIFTRKKICANRESNPALKLGKLQCYRYTIGAFQSRSNASVAEWLRR